VAAAEIDETPLSDEGSEAYVLRLAKGKARAAMGKAQPEEVIVAADTTVVDGASILGKPADPAQAVRMLRQLRSRTHQVYTGLAVFQVQGGECWDDTCRSDVSMRDYSDEEIEAYVASGDPFDKAGAYAIQHPGFNPARPLQGCYANVMGLPLCHLVRTLRKAGIHTSENIPAACQATLSYACPVFEGILEE
jgi:septum formation protein